MTERDVFLDWYNNSLDRPCPGCGGEWVRESERVTVLDHTGDCPYMKWLNDNEHFPE